MANVFITFIFILLTVALKLLYNSYKIEKMRKKINNENKITKK
jgi:hypothetical protein